ncbi:MAG: glutamate--tRNA ligase [Bacteroidota bacterium]
MNRVRVRFAPSPTGPLHMGGVRTALYNYLFARQHDGDFILRIEDTDQHRFVPGAEEYIIESLKWCGISPNEGVGFGDGPHTPYRQSERKDLYKKYADQLIDSGHAYYAFDTAEDLELRRKSAESVGTAFSYSSTTRGDLVNSLNLSQDEVRRRIDAGDPYVIRLKIPAGETIHVSDLIRGDVHVETAQLDDKVLFKSDGMPTYHLANVVDDHLMLITHVIRGEEWLPSAPLHVLLYRYLGWESTMPLFAHLPLLLKPDGNGKLSKRDGDRLGFPVFPLNWKDPVSGETASGYRENGYYPESFLNIISLLGWHPADERELLTKQEMIESFSLERVSKSGARFDPEKTKWINEHYMRALPDAQLALRFRDRVAAKYAFPENDRRLSEGFLVQAVGLLKVRAQFEHEFLATGSYLFEAPVAFDETVITKKWKPELAEVFVRLAEAFVSLEPFNASTAESALKSVAEASGRKPGELLQLFRVMLSGQAGGVDLFPMVGLLGREETVQRIGSALKHLMALV